MKWIPKIFISNIQMFILLLFAATVESFKNKIVDHTSPDQGKSLCEFLLLGSCVCEFPSLYTYLQ